MTSKRTVYVEATAMLRKKRTGVDYYAQGLLSELARQMHDTQFVCFAFDDIGDTLAIDADNISFQKIHHGPSKLFRLRLLLGLAPKLEQLLGLQGVECVIFPNFYMWPIRTRAARVYPVVYDTTYIDCPEYVDRRNQILLKKLVKGTVKQATKVITISKASRSALQSHYGRPNQDYLIAYPAPALHSDGSTSRIEALLPRQYFLFVGTIEPRKNVENVIRAHLSLSPEIREKYPLVIAGGKGWKDEEILTLIAQNEGNNLQYLGYVSDAEKYCLYKKAHAMVYPAKLEGFGMPVVESLQAGLPVITSNNSSLPEAGGDAAYYCDGTVDGIAGAMQDSLQDKSRQQRIARGKEYAKKFSWRESARLIKQELERIP